MSQPCLSVKYPIQTELETWDVILVSNSPFTQFRQWYCVDDRLDTGGFKTPSEDALDLLQENFGKVVDFGDVMLTADGFQEAAQLYCLEE